MEMTSLGAAARLGAALAAGLLVGLERGWREREQPEGSRVAGLRTFALIGLLGGILGMDEGSGLAVAAGLAAISLLFVVSFGRSAAMMGSLSITTAVSALVTFGLGVMASRGHMLMAIGAAAVVALLLGMKQELHGGMQRMAPEELKAVLQLGVLTAAVLPLLPDAGWGPYAAWNPFRLWLAVILVAAISLGGHVAVRWKGRWNGLLWTGVAGGIASSTAATLSLSRSVRAEPSLAPAAAAGVVAACGAMFVRMAVVACILQPALVGSAGIMLSWLAAASFAIAAWQWRRAPRSLDGPAREAAESRVFDLPTAIGFGLLLAAILVAVRAAQDSLGSAGIYGVALLSGTVDVDAILISTLQAHADGGVPLPVAGKAIALAVFANLIAKAAIAWFIGGARLGKRVLAGHLAVVAAALAAFAFALALGLAGRLI